MTKPRMLKNSDLYEIDYGSINTQTTSLTRGLQTITVDKNTPLNVLNIDGRTLINLLGRDGNCEDINKWNGSGATIGLDGTNKLYGSNGIKITLTSSADFIGMYKPSVQLDASKYHIAVADVKNGNASSNIYLQFSGLPSSFVTDTTRFNTVYVKATPAQLVNTNISIIVHGLSGEYGYVDGIRIYQLADVNEYNALATMTTDQIAAKYPYVDDMKHVQNPYLIKSGKNLLPPFQQWTLHPNVVVTDAYKMTLNASAAAQQSYTMISVVAGQTYTLSSATNGQTISINANDESGGYLSGIIIANTTNSFSFTVPINAKKITVYVLNQTIATGSFIFDKLMLNLGSTALPFEPQNNDYLYLNATLASSADGSVKDYAYYKDGNYVKAKRFAQIDVDGRWGFTHAADGAGSKQIMISNILPNTATGSLPTVVKYDGKIIARGEGTTAADLFGFSPPTLYINVADANSGWGETYQPTPEEIKAYFLGWLMYNSAVSGLTPYTGAAGEVKAWDNREGGVFGAVPTIPTNAFTSGKLTYYKLQYQLTNEQEELIQFEGDIQLHNGANQIEMGEGVIIREKANPKLFGGLYYVNVIDSIIAGSRLSNKASTLLGIYKNGIKQTIAPYSSTNTSTWMKDSNENSNGLFHLGINLSAYDPTAEYTVSYIVLQDGSFRSSIDNSIAIYDTNLGNILNNTNQKLTDITTKQSITDIRLDKTFIKGLGERTEMGATTIASGTNIWKNYHNYGVISFSRSFTSVPYVYTWCPDSQSGNNGYPIITVACYNTTTGFNLYYADGSGTAGLNTAPNVLDTVKTVFWIAIGK